MFILTAAISAFLLATCVDAAPGIRRHHPDGRIIGGTNANISEIPYQVSLEYEGYHICGASVINEWFAITAAHCVNGAPTSSIRFRAGTSLREVGGSLHPAEEVFIHPEFHYLTMEYDVAVVAVSVPFVFGENVSPIPVAASESAPGSTALVSGWGITHIDGDLPAHLQKVVMYVVDHDTCNKEYSIFGGMTKNMICAVVEEGGKDSCFGDNGGPLVVGEELVGIVSGGLGCGIPGFPRIYTNLPVVFQELRKMVHSYPRFNHVTL